MPKSRPSLGHSKLVADARATGNLEQSPDRKNTTYEQEESSTAISRREMLRRAGAVAAGLSAYGCLPLFGARNSGRFKIGACDWSIGKMADPAAFEVARRMDWMVSR